MAQLTHWRRLAHTVLAIQPESYFFREMMAWDLIKFIISALARLQGQSLLDEYLWLIKNLEAHDELRRHMCADLGGEL